MKTQLPLNLFSRCALVISTIFFLSTCQKEIVSPQKNVAEAQHYFERQVLSDTSQKVSDNNPRHTVAKEPFWAEAKIENMPFGEAVVVPLVYTQAISLQTEIGPIPLSELSYLLIYKDAQKHYHAEVVTKLPEKNYRPNYKNPNSPFKGVILVEDWWGNTIRNIGLGIAGPENLLGYVIPQAKGQKPPTGNMMLEEQHCYNQVWEITICGGGAEGCTTHNEIDQVCFTMYTDTGNGGGGGIGSGYPSPIDYGFMPHAGGGYNTLPEATFMNKIDDTQLKPCMKSILNGIKTLSNGSVAGIIQKFAGETPGFNWTLKDGVLPQNWNGSTNPIYNAGTVTTTFDSQKFTHASDLAIARTILHESVHAYLVAYFKNEPIIAQNTYSEMVEEWESKKHPNLNSIQHNEIIRNFMLDIGVSLKEYGGLKGYNLTTEFCNDLAWGGLAQNNNGTLTELFKKLVPNVFDQDRILNELKVEQTGQDLGGNTQDQKGSKNSCNVQTEE
ncbi:MAG: hypothetical protein ACKOWL_05580 [Sphingobacteriaceae bacterium]